jgi:hypothetical protein
MNRLLEVAAPASVAGPIVPADNRLIRVFQGPQANGLMTGEEFAMIMNRRGAGKPVSEDDWARAMAYLESTRKRPVQQGAPVEMPPVQAPQPVPQAQPRGLGATANILSDAMRSTQPPPPPRR